jgi:hypothetical protein
VLFTAETRQKERQIDYLNALSTAIINSIHLKYKVYVDRKENAAQIVQALKERVAPSNREINDKLQTKYRELIDRPKGLIKEGFIASWEDTIYRMQERNMIGSRDKRQLATNFVKLAAYFDSI